MRGLLTLLLCTGCSQISYVAHVSVGQMGVLVDRERLTTERVAALSADERRRLDAVQAAKAYAEVLGLKASSSYRHLIDRPPERRVRVVVAAPADRLEPLTWWFPIVGRVAYRGYFDAERARCFQEHLSAQGFDTYARPALLYSTLGWFDDPIPRELLRLEEFEVVDAILHELVHETIFVAGDTAYNEGLATFIAQRATLAHFEADPRTRAAAERAFADQALFGQLMSSLAHDLEALYANSPSPGQARHDRAPIFRRYQDVIHPSLSWQTSRYAGFARSGLSNAYVLANQTYLGDAGCFIEELRELGGDLAGFVRAHRAAPGRRRPQRDCPPGEAAWQVGPSSS